MKTPPETPLGYTVYVYRERQIGPENNQNVFLFSSCFMFGQRKINFTSTCHVKCQSLQYSSTVICGVLECTVVAVVAREAGGREASKFGINTATNDGCAGQHKTNFFIGLRGVCYAGGTISSGRYHEMPPAITSHLTGAAAVLTCCRLTVDLSLFVICCPSVIPLPHFKSIASVLLHTWCHRI